MAPHTIASLSRGDAAERAIAEHPDRAKLVRLMGDMHGELLQDQPGL